MKKNTSSSLLRAIPAILSTILCTAILTSCGNKPATKDKDFIREVTKNTGEMPEPFEDLFFIGPSVTDEELIIETTVDHQLYGSRIKEEIERLWQDNDWKEDFRHKMVDRYANLIKLANDRGLDICWRIYANIPGDGFDIRISPDEVESLRQENIQNAAKLEQAEIHLKEIAAKMNETFSENLWDGVKFKQITITPVNVIYNFEVDESVTSIKQLEDDIATNGKNKTSEIFRSDINENSLLLAAADANVGIIYRYTGSKTRHDHDYVIITPEELQKHRKASKMR